MSERTLTIALPCDLGMFLAALNGVTQEFPNAILRNEGRRYVIVAAPDPDQETES